MNATIRPRYTPTIRRLHWLMAVLILLAYVFIEQRGLFPRGTPGRAAMMQAHFWAGLAIFVLVWWRLVARKRGGTPPITPPLDKFSALFAKLVHVALYAFFIVMPILGIVTAWLTGKQLLIPMTEIALPTPLAVNKDLGHQIEDIHGTIGEVFYWVIGLHVVAAIWHQVFKHDNTLERML